MQIPNNLQAFPYPAFIATTDNVRAMIYKAEDRTIELVAELPEKKKETEESEHTTINLDDRALEKKCAEFYDSLSTALQTLTEKNHVNYLAIICPQERMEELKEHLHIQLLKKVFVYIGKNLVNEDPIDLVAHVQEEAS
ncbi:MAG: hypothetical protein ABIH21_04465 [Patescibacteria group bacterium]